MRGIRQVVIGILLSLVSLSCHNSTSDQSDSVGAGSDSLTVSEKAKIQNFWAYYRQATKDRIAGLWQEAADGYIKSIELNQEHLDARYYLGNMYLELSQFEQAEACWIQLIQLNPKSSRAHFQLGNLYLNYKLAEFYNLNKAWEEFQKTTEINKDFLQPVLHLAQISLIKADYADSRERLLTVTGSDEKSVEAYFLLGFISYVEGKNQEALSYLLTAKKLSAPQKATEAVKGEGDTKTGKSLGRSLNQSVFSTHLINLGLDTGPELEMEMQDRYSELSSFLKQLRNFEH